MYSFIVFLSVSLIAWSAQALTPAQWRSQTIYQVLTDRFARTDGSTIATCNTGDQAYCHGSWQGIINHLDYIQKMGFTAIWISPVVENLPQSTSDGESYHGYWAQDIYSLNSNFGAASDLKALSAALHSRGMYLMVDVVTNHMGFAGCGNCVDYSVFNPFNSQSYYHPFCLIDYSNQTSTEQCWEGDNTVSLPDLRTEDSNVLGMWQTWVKQLVANYTIDGLRIDSSSEVDKAFFPPFESAAGVYAVGEVFNGDPAYVCPYQNYVSGVLNYPAYYWITQAFQSTGGSISNLVNGINTMKSSCKDTTLLGSFMENHDVARFPSLTSDISLAKNAIAFTLLADGIPIMYEGQEQHYSGGGVPNNREAVWLSGYSTSATLYTHITMLNRLRLRAIQQDSNYATYKANPIYSDGSTIVMRKGSTGSQIISVFSNKGTNGNSYTLSLPSSGTGFASGQTVIEVLSCTSYSTDSSGNLAVSMSGGLPRVFYPAAQLSGSGICSMPTGPTTTTTPTSCPTSSSISIIFRVTKTTNLGETVKIAGSIPQLGSWNPANAVTLSASQYTSSNPVWVGTVSLQPGQALQYKYIVVESSGSVTWENDPNRSYTVPVCGGTVADTWQG